MYKMTVDYDNIGVDYEEDPPVHCPGPSYDGAHGCGRFLRYGDWVCTRCQGETSEYWRDRQEVHTPSISDDLPF